MTLLPLGSAGKTGTQISQLGYTLKECILFNEDDSFVIAAFRPDVHRLMCVSSTVTITFAPLGFMTMYLYVIWFNLHSFDDGVEQCLTEPSQPLNKSYTWQNPVYHFPWSRVGPQSKSTNKQSNTAVITRWIWQKVQWDTIQPLQHLSDCSDLFRQQPPSPCKYRRGICPAES